MSEGGEWRKIAADRPTQAYDFGWWDGKPRHYLARSPAEAYSASANAVGAIDRAGRRFRLIEHRCAGIRRGDVGPALQAHPVLHHAGGETGACFGLFYDTYADCAFDFGCERSNYHGIFRSFDRRDGDLDYYVIAGPERWRLPAASPG